MSGISGNPLQARQEIEQHHIIIPQFDYASWRNNIDEAIERDVGRRTLSRTDILLEDIVMLLTSNRYRRGPRRFFESNRQYYEEGIRNAVQRDMPLEFVLPSFPVKCFNPLKVRRRTPDLAEVGCLSRLYSLCRDIEQIYQPGAMVILVTDGLVYAPIFREPIAHAQRYREEIDELIVDLGYRKYITSVDMGDLVASREDEFNRIYQMVEIRVADHYERYPNDSDRQRLIENTMTNINLTMYPERDLIDFFVNENNSALQEEIRERATASAFEYLVFNQTLREIELVQRAFPNALRVTCHPKEGQLGLHLVHPNSFNYPWNGVGILRENGTVRVEFEYEARRNPNYVAVYIEGESHPFFFQSR